MSYPLLSSMYYVIEASNFVLTGGFVLSTLIIINYSTFHDEHLFSTNFPTTTRFYREVEEPAQTKNCSPQNTNQLSSTFFPRVLTFNLSRSTCTNGTFSKNF